MLKIARDLCLVFIAVASASHPSCRSRADEPSNFRKLEDASIHAIGIAEPQNSYLPRRDVASWKKLVRPLLKQAEPAKRVWNLLDKAAQAACSNDEIFEEQPNGVTTELRASVRAGLERILENPEFYSKESFKGVELPDELVSLIKLGNKRSFIQTLRLNRELLGFALPDAFADVPTNYHGVAVKVSGEKRIILVLSSNHACRWSVEVEKGSEVAGVILIGYHTQEVEGIKAPVIYRCHDGPDGKGTKFQSVHVRKESDRNYPAFLALIKDLTGKEPDSFQGEYRAPKDGFAVPAKK